MHSPNASYTWIRHVLAVRQLLTTSSCCPPFKQTEINIVAQTHQTITQRRSQTLGLFLSRYANRPLLFSCKPPPLYFLTRHFLYLLYLCSSCLLSSSLFAWVTAHVNNNVRKLSCLSHIIQRIDSATESTHIHKTQRKDKTDLISLSNMLC